MSGLIFAQAFALSCLIALVVGFIFAGGFVCGQMWQARVDQKMTEDDQ